MHIQDVMTHEVDLVDPNMTIRDAARLMRQDNVGALPVGENDRLVGMVTDRDIVTRAVADDRSPGNTSVRDVMSEHIYYCYEDEGLDRAAELMSEHQIRRLPVLNRNKRLVGIVSLADLSRSGDGASQHALHGVSQPSDQPRH